MAEYKIQMDGAKQSVNFVVADVSGNHLIDAALTDAGAIFNNEWHQIGIQVMDSQASLFVDCAKVSTTRFDLSLALINEFRDANVAAERKRTQMCTRRVNNDVQVVPVDIQFFVIVCNPEDPERATCDVLWKEDPVEIELADGPGIMFDTARI